MLERLVFHHPLILHAIAILYKLKVDTQLKMIPTVGFNVESIMLKGYKLNIWVLDMLIFTCNII